MNIVKTICLRHGKESKEVLQQHKEFTLYRFNIDSQSIEVLDIEVDSEEEGDELVMGILRAKGAGCSTTIGFAKSILFFGEDKLS